MKEEELELKGQCLNAVFYIRCVGQLHSFTALTLLNIKTLFPILVDFTFVPTTAPLCHYSGVVALFRVAGKATLKERTKNTLDFLQINVKMSIQLRFY